MIPTVYSKPACIQCTATLRYLDNRGVEYNYIDLTEDEEARAHVEGLGYRQAPVVEWFEEHWSGYRPDLIDAVIGRGM